MNIEKYKNKWHETIEKLKVSEFCDWFKAYFYIFTTLIALYFGLMTLSFVFIGNYNSLATLGETVRLFFLISLILIFLALVTSAISALMSVVFFRYIPRISILFMIMHSGFLSLGATHSTSNSLYKNQNFIVPTPFLVSIFLVFYFLIILAHYLVITIVIKNVNKRSSHS